MSLAIVAVIGIVIASSSHRYRDSKSIGKSTSDSDRKTGIKRRMPLSSEQHYVLFKRGPLRKVCIVHKSNGTNGRHTLSWVVLLSPLNINRAHAAGHPDTDHLTGALGFVASSCESPMRDKPINEFRQAAKGTWPGAYVTCQDKV